MDVYLGSNLVQDCQAVLVIEGKEVFCLRDRLGDGRLVVDFDLDDSSGNRIAKIAGNNVVYAADEFEFVSEARISFVRKKATGEIIAQVEELSLTSIRITGDFWNSGHHILITPDAVRMGGVTLKQITIQGFKRAIVINRGRFTIGSS